tara:strand:- start:560 stop:664 length:105 start_codon:yes stop_codon:yes gene_type:complete
MLSLASEVPEGTEAAIAEVEERAISDEISRGSFG